ncbi:MAG: hypothetical protein ACXW15_01100 [Acidimicrobiia bacterium]
MEALLFEFGEEGGSGWMAELADALVEDPHCLLVLMGSDQRGVVLVTIWDAEMIGEVEAGLADLVANGVRLRRLSMVDPRNPAGLFSKPVEADEDDGLG